MKELFSESPLKSTLPSSPDGQLVLLVSRGLVHLLGTRERQNTLLEELVNAVFSLRDPHSQTIRDNSEVEVLVIVVDATSTPDHGLVAKLLRHSRAIHHTATDTVKPPADGTEATEGIAYHASSTPLFETPSHTTREASLSLRPDVASSLEGAPLMQVNLLGFKHGEGSEQRPHTTLTLPIANTLFQTGQKSTAYLAQMGVKEDTLRVANIRGLEDAEYSIMLPWPELTKIDRTNGQLGGGRWYMGLDHVDIKVPLSYLAPLRPIANSMGNIVTKLLDPETNVAIPASQELEKAVTDYLGSNGIAADGLTVWALIIPQNLVAGEHARLINQARELWAGSAHSLLKDRLLISQLVWRGAKLRRVLSGGGGWGQKAGLLSLDPDDHYKAGPSDTPEMPPFLADMHADNSLNLPNIAQAGDLIAFFAFHEDLEPPRATSLEDIQQPTGEWSLSFGTIPSTMDSMPARNEAADDTVANHPLLEHLPGHFGALSEGGMSVARSQEHVQTKLDVPNTCFSFATVERTPPRPVTGQGKKLVQNAAIQGREFLVRKTTTPDPSLVRKYQYRRGEKRPSVQERKVSTFAVKTPGM